MHLLFQQSLNQKHIVAVDFNLHDSINMIYSSNIVVITQMHTWSICAQFSEIIVFCMYLITVSWGLLLVPWNVYRIQDCTFSDEWGFLLWIAAAKCFRQKAMSETLAKTGIPLKPVFKFGIFLCHQKANCQSKRLHCAKNNHYPLY